MFEFLQQADHSRFGVCIDDTGAILHIGLRGRLDGEIVYSAVGMPGLGGEPEQVLADIARVQQALAPAGNGRRYLNFAERPTTASEFFDPETLARLSAIRTAIDPDDLLLSNHAVPVAA